MHTPGPWSAGRAIPEDNTISRIVRAGDDHIAVVMDLDGAAQEAADNARLIAAAPKMLDDLRSIAYVTPKDHNGKISYKNAYESMVRVALGAISAATGGQ